MSFSRRAKRKHEAVCGDSQVLEKRNNEEEETVYDQLLSLLGPRRRRRRRKSPKHQRQTNHSDHNLPPSDPQVAPTSLVDPVMDQGLPTSRDEGTVFEDGDDVRGEYDIDKDSESGDGGGGDCSEGEESEDEKEVREDPLRRHFDHLLTNEEISSLSSPPPPLPPSHSPPLGLITHIPGIPHTQSAVAWQPVSLSQMSIKPKLCQNWSATSPTAQLTDLQKHLFPILTSYKDLLFTQRTVENAEELCRPYVLHVLNHVLKTRSRVMKNNHKLLLASKEGRQLEEPRDQGLTRPKVLILVPFRHAALQVVETLASLLLPHGQGVVHNQRRFRREYGGGGEEAQRSRVVPKPSSYTAMFTGNTDDCFKLGVAVSGKTLRLFADFYSSDIILASPLGLRTVIGAEGEKKRDYDFLSSVEVLVLDQADVFLMQNWEHVTHVLRHLHLKPRESHGADFSRVRLWALNEWSSFYRQTIVLSSLLTPEINSIITTHCSNYEGCVRCDVGREEGSVGQVARQIPQTFVKLSSSSSPSQLPDHRLQHFSSQVLSGYHGDLMKGTVIFIPSYFDFVRVRNLLKREEVSFAAISEYTTMSGVTRARTQFYQGLTHFLLYTERAHFFHRYRLKGVRHVVFYSVPTYPEHYSDLVNMVECQEGSVEVIYSSWEQLALCRVVGGARAQRMMTSNDSTHLIVTEHYIKSS